MRLNSGLEGNLYGGAGVSSLVPGFVPIAIGGRPYVIEPSRYKRRSTPAFRPSTDTTAEPGDAALAVGPLWRRSQSSWRHGAGQKRWDMYPPRSAFSTMSTDRERFWRSKGVDPWDESGVTLLRDAVSVSGSSSSNLRLVLAGSRVYLLDGTVLRYWPAATATSGIAAALTAVTGTPGTTPTGIATDGVKVWIACAASGLYVTDTGSGAAAALGAAGARDGVWYAGGRLFASYGAALYEHDAAGAVATTFTTGVTLPSGWTWTAVEQGPGFIYAAGYAGTQGAIYRMDYDASTGALRAALVAATSWPRNETALALKAYGGLVLIGGSKGLRLAQAAADGSLTYGPVIEVGAVRSIDVDGKFAWFTWSGFDDSDYQTIGGVSAGCGRADLSVDTTGALTPAYATDVMVTSTGSCTSLVRSTDGRVFFAVVGGSVYGLYAQSDTDYRSSGYVDMGEVSLGVGASKLVHSVDFDCDAVAGTITVQVVNDSGAQTDSAPFTSSASSTGPSSPISLGGARAERPRLVIYLARGSSTVAPKVRQWVLLASVVPSRSEEFEVPIIWRSEVRPRGAESPAHPQDLGDELDFLRDLVASGAETVYQEGARSYRVRCDGFEVEGSSWGDRGAYLEGICTVVLHTTE